MVLKEKMCVCVSVSICQTVSDFLMNSSYYAVVDCGSEMGSNPCMFHIVSSGEFNRCVFMYFMLLYTVYWSVLY